MEPVVEPVVETPPEPIVAPPIESTPEPVVAPLVEPPVPERKLSNIERIKGELKKDGLVNLKGGTRKKKLRTRRRDKQNVGRSRGGKNRSNRTDTYSSRRTEVDARGDELGL